MRVCCQCTVSSSEFLKYWQGVVRGSGGHAQRSDGGSQSIVILFTSAESHRYISSAQNNFVLFLRFLFNKLSGIGALSSARR